MQQAYKLLHHGILALGRAERAGIRIDLDYAHETSGKLKEKINSLEEVFKETKFYRHWVHTRGGRFTNMHSDAQLSNYLYKAKKLKPIKVTKSLQGSTDQEALEALNISELNDLIKIRKLKKIRETYLESFIREAVDGYIHPSFSLSNVISYRSSSSDPNFQNIPNRDEYARKIIRDCLYARPGHQILEIDYGALEVRIAACYHKDPTMLKYIRSDLDMHSDMTKQIFMLDKFVKGDDSMKKMRGGTKNGFVFPQFYGDYYGNNALSLIKWVDLPMNKRWRNTHGLPLPSGINLGEHMGNEGITSLSKFSDHLQEIEHHFWNERFPVYNRWKSRWFKQYQKTGYFDTLTGFRCSGVLGRNDVINYPVQGSAFHCLLWSFIELDRLMRDNKWDSRMIGQVHDSIVFDVHPDELEMVLEVVRRVTCVDLLKEWKWIIVPLDIEAEVCKVDEPWSTKKEIKFKKVA